MKFAFKSIVAATALIAAGAASAAVVTIDNIADAGDSYVVGGAGSLTFSTNLRNALNVGSVAASAFGGAESQITGPAGAYTNITVSAPITSITYDDVTGEVLTVKTAGGARQDASIVAGVSNGGWVEVGNLEVHVQTNEIYGTIVGEALNGTVVNWSGKLFDFASISGNTDFAEGTTDNLISTLALTPDGFAQIKAALDLQFLGEVSLQAASTNFGNIASSLTVTALPPVPAIPEPSTYALMGLGLVGIGFAARRRAAK